MPAEAKPRRRAAKASVAPAPASLPAPAAPLALPQPQGFWKFAALLLAFLAPPAGALLALLYWTAPVGAGRGFSRWCLALAALGLLLAGATEGFHGAGDLLVQPY